MRYDFLKVKFPVPPPWHGGSANLSEKSSAPSPRTYIYADRRSSRRAALQPGEYFRGARWRGDGATYRIALATAGALRSWQTPVSLLSGLTRGSDQTDQTWVTLQHTKSKRGTEALGMQMCQVNISAAIRLFKLDHHSSRVVRDEMIRRFGGNKGSQRFRLSGCPADLSAYSCQPINN